MTAKSAKHLGILVAPWVADCLVVSITASALWMSSEPGYNGRSLSYWFQRLPVLSGSDINAGYVTTYSPVSSAGLGDCRAALAAIRAIGTNSLPFLIRKLRGRPPPRLTKLIQRHAGNWPVIRTVFPARDLAKEQGQAVAGLLVLCPLPAQAEERGRVLALDFYGPAWYRAGYVLKANKDPAIARYALSPYK
jgi:hypothetical protein